MNRAQAVRALLACEVLAAELRRQLKADARAEYEEHENAPTWRFRGVTVSASLTRDRAYIADEAAFLVYVREVYPTELEEVPATVRLRPVWLNAFLEGLAGRGEPPCDKDGRLVPGVDIVAGGEFNTVTVTAEDTTKAELKAIAADIAAGKRPLALPAVEFATEVSDAA